MSALKTAILLAGGEGMRLRPMTETLPKPLARVANVALIEIILRQLASQGIERVALALAYEAEQIHDFCGDGARFGLHLDYVRENELLGSGGAIANVVENLPEYSHAPFLVGNSDVPSTADFRAAFALHTQQDAVATLICGHAENLEGLGLVEIDENGRVQMFHEKPAPGITTSHWANLAFWIFEPRLLTRLSSREYSRVEDGLFTQLLRENERLFAYRHDGFWLDVGTLPRYLQAQSAALDGVLPVPHNGEITHRYSEGGESCPSLLAPDARVEDGASLCYAVVGSGAHIARSAVLENAVVYENAVIEEGATVRRSVVGPNVRIPAGTTLCDEMSFRATP